MAEVSVAAETFADVEVSIPASRGGEASFVKLATGKLEIDAGLDVVLHMPPPLDPKSLGCLTRASAVPQDQAGRSLDVKLGSHGSAELYRLVFLSARDAARVADLADRAMSAEFNEWEENANARANDARSLSTALRGSLSGRRPLLYDGAQLLGPDPSGDGGDEVLLGEGVVALLDPSWGANVQLGGQLGEYELAFYSTEQGASEPAKRVSIGPKMRLALQERQRAEFDDDEEPATTFTLTTSGDKKLTLTFENLEVGENFERDFVVRQRLMDVASKTAKRQQELSKHQDELRKIKETSFLKQVVRVGQLALLAPALLLGVAALNKWFASNMCHLLVPDDLRFSS